MSYTIPYSKWLDWKNARKSAEVFVWEIIEKKNIENGRLKNLNNNLNRKLKSQAKNRDYWREKAENLMKENLYLKDHIKLLELELNIWKKSDL
jgi:hypothetical protein